MIVDYYYDEEGNCKIYKNSKLIKEEKNFKYYKNKLIRMKEIKGEIKITEAEGLLTRSEWEQGKKPEIHYITLFNAFEAVDMLNGADSNILFIIDGDLYAGNMDSYNLGDNEYWVKVESKKKPKNIKCYKYK